MSSSRREVVITGMGLVTPLGAGVEQNWEGVESLKTGISSYPRDGYPAFLQYLGRVREFEADKDIPPKLFGQVKFLNRGSLLGLAAAREALKQAGAEMGDIPPFRRALYIASGDMTKVGYDFMYPAVKDGSHGKWREMDFEKLNTSCLGKVDPFFLLESILNNLFSFLSAFSEFMGPNTCLASHSPCGGNALELASRSIGLGQADVALAVGCGSWLTDIPLYEMQGLGVLSQCRNGQYSYRPFDKKRDGFILGEGGAALFLEAAERAAQRKAAVLGRIRGFGNSEEFSTDLTLSVPLKVSAMSMRQAVEEAGCDPADLSFVSPHGSGSKKGDASELRSIIEVFGEGEGSVPICGLKSYTGHLAAASDIAEVILGVKALRHHLVPATLNFQESEDEFRHLRISGSHQRAEKDCFLSVSYGIGGQSSCIMVQGP